MQFHSDIHHIMVQQKLGSILNENMIESTTNITFLPAMKDLSSCETKEGEDITKLRHAKVSKY